MNVRFFPRLFATVPPSAYGAPALFIPECVPPGETFQT